MSRLEHIFNKRILNGHLPANSKWLCHLQRCPVRCTLCARTHILMRRLYCFHSSWQVIFRCCYFLRCPVRFSVNKNRRCINYAFCKKKPKRYTLIDSVENIFADDRLACILFAEYIRDPDNDIYLVTCAQTPKTSFFYQIPVSDRHNNIRFGF